MKLEAFYLYIHDGMNFYSQTAAIVYSLLQLAAAAFGRSQFQTENMPHITFPCLS
jgi:hypothetical protein